MSRKKKSDPGNFYPLGNVVIVSGGIWKTKPVASQPRLRLSSWRIMQTERGEIHFIGYAVDNHEGRVSTAIESLGLAAHWRDALRAPLRTDWGTRQRSRCRLRLGDVGSRKWRDTRQGRDGGIALGGTTLNALRDGLSDRIFWIHPDCAIRTPLASGRRVHTNCTRISICAAEKMPVFRHFPL